MSRGAEQKSLPCTIGTSRSEPPAIRQQQRNADLICKTGMSTGRRAEPNVDAFDNYLAAAGTIPMQAVVAVTFKLPHAIWGILKHDQDFDGIKCFKLAEETA